MPRIKDPVPEFAPLAEYLQEILRLCDASPWTLQNEFPKSGLRHSTLNDAIAGKSLPSLQSIKVFAEVMSQKLNQRRRDGLILEQEWLPEYESAERLKGELMAIVEEVQGKRPKVERSTRPQSKKINVKDFANWVSHHFGRFDNIEQGEAAIALLALLSRTSTNWVKDEEAADLTPLVASIKNAMAQAQAGTIEAYANFLIDEAGIPRKDPQRQALINGLNLILQSSQLPEVNTAEYAATFRLLAKNLLNGKFDGSPKDLLSFFLSDRANYAIENGAEEPAEM